MHKSEIYLPNDVEIHHTDNLFEVWTIPDIYRVYNIYIYLSQPEELYETWHVRSMLDRTLHAHMNTLQIVLIKKHLHFPFVLPLNLGP